MRRMNSKGKARCNFCGRKAFADRLALCYMHNQRPYEDPDVTGEAIKNNCAYYKRKFSNPNMTKARTGK